MLGTVAGTNSGSPRYSSVYVWKITFLLHYEARELLFIYYGFMIIRVQRYIDSPFLLRLTVVIRLSKEHCLVNDESKLLIFWRFVFTAQSGSVEKRRRHSFSCDQYLPCADKTQLTWAEWMEMEELENRVEAKKQIDNLRQEVNKLKEKSAKKEKKWRATIAKKTAELELVKKVNEDLLKDYCFKASSLSESLQMLKIVKDACLNFKNSYQVLSMNIEGMEQGEKHTKKVVFESIGKYHMAIQYFDQCLDTILRESEAVEISVHGNLGNVFYSLSKYQEALKCYERALEIAQKSEGKKEQMIAHRNLGIVHGKLNQYEEAIQHHKKQLQVAKEFGDKMKEGKAYENLGAVYSKVQEYEKALEYYEKLLKIARENKDVMRGYRNLGDICKQLGRYNEAIINFEECLKNATEGEGKDKMKALESLGEIYEQLENYEEVVWNYTKYTEVTDDMNGKANAYESLGNAYRKLGKYDDALLAFNKCLSIAKDINDKEIEANVYGSMEVTYMRLGETKEAMNCQNQRRKLEDRVFQRV